MLWRTTITGHEGIGKLRQLAAETPNELQVLHLPTKALVATMNQKAALS